MVHNFSEIPDDIKTKEFFPLMKHIWRCFKQLGWEFWEKQRETVYNSNMVYDLLRHRLNESILTAKAVMEGKFEKPHRIMTYTLFPPIVAIRSDAQTGTMKLIFGFSIDTTYTIIDDISQEVIYLVNCSLEDGIPIDWWFINFKDDTLDRRHIKYGFKLREIPKRTRTIKNASIYMSDVLKDIRNERSPIRQSSSYHVGATYLSPAINQMFHLSNFDSYGGFWDGIQSTNKNYFRMSDLFFIFYPWPPIMNTLMLAGRRAFISKWSTWAGGKLYINHIEDIIINWLKDSNPEIFKVGLLDQIEEGIPYPKQSLISGLDLRKNYHNYGEYFWSEDENRIRIENLGISMDEAFEGYYLRVDKNTPINEKVDFSKIISIGMGRNSRILQD
ncbi:MAG: hypothetical protein ACTSO9_10435 [Candidatus Helarchaeota archaeon]